MAGALAMRGQVVLTIDVSHPSAVVITGTGAFSAANFTGVSTTFPIWLTDFFTTDSNGDNPTFSASGSTLSTTGSTHTLGAALVRFIPGAKSLVLRQSGPSSESFLTTSAAFTGQAAFNLTEPDLSGVLHSAGWTGNVLAYNGSATTFIGTYLVTAAVPEPNNFGLICAATGLTCALARRRRG